MEKDLTLAVGEKYNFTVRGKRDSYTFIQANSNTETGALIMIFAPSKSLEGENAESKTQELKPIS